MENVKLSAHDLNCLEELNLEKASTKSTLLVALNYHSNRMEEIKKEENVWWKNMIAKYDLDPSKRYKTDKLDRDMYIIANEDSE